MDRDERHERLRRAGLRTPEQAQAMVHGLTPAEFGRRTGGRSRQTVHEDIKAGRVAALPVNPGAIRIRYRIPESEVARYLRDNMANPERWEDG